jgi:hypothetical protein
MRTPNTFALDVLKRSITSVLVLQIQIKMRETQIKVFVINELNYQCYLVQALCLIACWVEDPNGEAYKLHLGRIPDNYWVAEDGLKFQVIYMIKKHVCMLINNHIYLKHLLKSLILENFGPFKVKYFILKCTK